MWLNLWRATKFWLSRETERERSVYLSGISEAVIERATRSHGPDVNERWSSRPWRCSNYSGIFLRIQEEDRIQEYSCTKLIVRDQSSHPRRWICIWEMRGKGNCEWNTANCVMCFTTRINCDQWIVQSDRSQLSPRSSRYNGKKMNVSSSSLALIPFYKIYVIYRSHEN